jgi:hypothetical protein
VHAFVDETKEKGLLIAATLSEPRHVEAARKALRQKLLKGQRRLHFKQEKDARRQEICTVICELPVKVYIYDASGIRSQVVARRQSLTRLVQDLADLDGRRLLIEKDDSVFENDKRTLYQAVAKFGVQGILYYDHMKPHEEPLLWVSDAVAWCVAKGGDWRKRVEPVITTTVRVEV